MAKAELEVKPDEALAGRRQQRSTLDSLRSIGGSGTESYGKSLEMNGLAMGSRLSLHCRDNW